MLNTSALDYCLNERPGWAFTTLAGKVPIRKGWQSESPLGRDILFSHDDNIGLRTGAASGVVVVDIDEGANLAELDFPETIEVVTGSGGTHYYYSYGEPMRNSASKLTKHVDVRADGGQVVFPGSIHPDSKEEYYFREGRAPWQIALAPLPEWIIDAHNKPVVSLPPPPQPNLPQTDIPSTYAQAALKDEMDKLSQAVQGTRNHTLNVAAFAMGQFVGAGALERALVEDALMREGTHLGLDLPEIQAAITSGIQDGMKQPRVMPPPISPPPISPPPISLPPVSNEVQEGDVLLPGAHLNGQGVIEEQGSDKFARKVLNRFPADVVFGRDSLPGTLAGKPGEYRWRELSVDRMRILIDGHVKLKEWKNSKKPVLCYRACTKDVAGLVIGQAEAGHQNVPPLDMIVRYPVYDPDWNLAKPGYNPSSGIYFDPAPDIKDGIIPEIMDIQDIHVIYDNLLADFPFETESDRENFLGLLLTPIVAPAIQGNRPMHLITASIERTGKSKLAEDVLGGILLGHKTPAMQITGSDEERDKRITAQLLTGGTILCLDNLPHKLDSAAIASLLTAEVYQGRHLGHSTMLSLKNTLTVVATGNNVVCTGEIAKRIVPIVLQPRDGSPEKRTNFRHDDLSAWIRSERRQILTLLLGMVEKWKPKRTCEDYIYPPVRRPMGGFEAWSRTVGDILWFSGFQQWRKNEGAWHNRADCDSEMRENFTNAWFEEYGMTEVSSEQLLHLCQGRELMDWVLSKPTDQARKSALGKWVKSHHNTPIRDVKMQSRRGNKGMVYYLESNKPRYHPPPTM